MTQKQMKFIPIKTRKFLPPKDKLIDLIASLPKLKNGDIVFITSKVLAITQGRCIKMDKVKKEQLIQQEADYLVKRPIKMAHAKIYLTIKDSTLIPSAGIDESNGNGYYILWPKNTEQYLKKIHGLLLKKNKIKNLGLVSTDSHTTPLRWGVSGISTGYYGFKPLKDLRRKEDLFGRKLKFTQVNIVDSLSAMAVLLMGEGKEGRPVVVLRGYKDTEFSTKYKGKDFFINPEHDIYGELLKKFRKS